MDLQKFIEKFADTLDVSAKEISDDTEFKDLKNWNSLTLLAIIEMVDYEYDVTLKGKEIQEAETIQDLFDLIKERKK